MSTLVELKYGYDRASNRKYRRDEVARNNSALFDELYDYDGLYRLTELDRGELNSGNTTLDAGPSLTQDWTLDPLGNWNHFQQGVSGALDQTREHNPVNEIVDIDKTVGTLWPTPAYDNNGNTTTLPQPKALEDSYTGVYDAWNRLVKLTNDADSDKTVAEYQYDGLNRRAVKKVYDSGGTLDTTRHAYFSDGWQVLEERVDSSTDPERQFLWGERYIDDLVLRDRDTDGNGTLDERLYALSDALFNVVALTDETGDVKERFAYQPYGLSEALDPDFDTYSGTDYQWEYRFTGRELDLESGLQINRHRYLHLELGRWLWRDPIGYWSNLSLYEYALSSPIQFVDPLGLKECWSCLWRRFNDLDPKTGNKAWVLSIKVCLDWDSTCREEDCGTCVGEISPTITVELSSTAWGHLNEFAQVGNFFLHVCGQSKRFTLTTKAYASAAVNCDKIGCIDSARAGHGWLAGKTDPGLPDIENPQSGVFFGWGIRTGQKCGEIDETLLTKPLVSGILRISHEIQCKKVP